MNESETESNDSDIDRGRSHLSTKKKRGSGKFRLIIINSLALKINTISKKEKP